MNMKIYCVSCLIVACGGSVISQPIDKEDDASIQTKTSQIAAQTDSSDAPNNNSDAPSCVLSTESTLCAHGSTMMTCNYYPMVVVLSCTVIVKTSTSEVFCCNLETD